VPRQVNASITRIQQAGATVGGGDVDDWDTPGTDSPDEEAGGAGSEKWAGAISAYYREKVDRVPDGAGGINVLTRRTLWIDSADAEALAIDTDDVVTFTARGASQTGQAKTIARAALPGVAANIQTTRIDLEDA
jgi:hypothetical protein